MKKLFLAGAILALAPALATAQMPDNIVPFVQVSSNAQQTTISVSDANGLADLNLSTFNVRVNGVTRTTDLIALIIDGSVTVTMLNNGFRITIPGDHRNLTVFTSIRDLSGRRGYDTNQN